ncbi:UPF0648 protein C3H5.09c [Golovinomyces cichoracearum]|uniref:UPF0648 protein C3H5.09c n=1 Tax=Golovinomyces cichoracearum TaxID=62708 RepID=A0A420IFX9_9PEZI|nr:UPF0648 protein C3H5.09c [Golovinomyces cichoracearum]
MALLNSTFIFGVIVVSYLSSFVLFAILRILTGISIQRLGYFSLRRVTYTLRTGVEIEIRGLGLNIHRPTFAQPTWLSIVLTELTIKVDLKATEKENIRVRDEKTDKKRDFISSAEPHGKLKRRKYEAFRNKTWKQLTAIKERLKLLHRNINWIRLADLVATNSTIRLIDVGKIQLGSFAMAVDTRRKITDQGMIFSPTKASKKIKLPAEWIISVRSVLFTAEGGNPVEVLDHATLNIHGLLYRGLDGLQDSSISLKLGRVFIPYDDVRKCLARYQTCRRVFEDEKLSSTGETPHPHVMEKSRDSSHQKENPAQTHLDSKELISSILRGIKEIQFVASFVGFTKMITSVQPYGVPIYLNASMKEVGIDLHRLDKKSPSHRMYFSSKDIAHQALVAALSIAFGLDTDGHTERLAYIPMATTTIRTTSISKLVELTGKNSADERNANILFANFVITSPSLDLDPKHLALLLSITQSNPRKINKQVESWDHQLISRLLPKASVKFSMHEPVIRITLPPVDKDIKKGDFDLIISSISSIYLDIESSHSSIGDLHYNIGSTLRLQSHSLYYQTSSGIRHELLETESFELKTQVSAKDEFYVVVTGTLKKFSVFMIRSEITDGIHQIVRQLHPNEEPKIESLRRGPSDSNYIRALPPWLVHFSIQISGFSLEIAGIDEEVSDQTRGLALQVQSCIAEYQIPKCEITEINYPIKCVQSRTLTSNTDANPGIPLSSYQKKTKLKSQLSTDNRMLSFQVKGLQAFMVESSQKWEHDPFISMPKFECNFSTAHDDHGPVLCTVFNVKFLIIKYSLYRHYVCGVVVTMMRRVFKRKTVPQGENKRMPAATTRLKVNDIFSSNSDQGASVLDSLHQSHHKRERISIKISATLLQIKVQIPSDPAILLQIYDMEAGWYNTIFSFTTARLVRFFAEAPKIRRVWARIASVKNFRIDYRESGQKDNNSEAQVENLIDVNAEATRIVIPHQLVVHKVIDNILNTAKSAQKLHQRFVVDSNLSVSEKIYAGPKLLPNLLIRCKAFLFELEDGAFEWKLGVIYRTGLMEQAQRLVRQAAFDIKARKIQDDNRKDASKHRNKYAPNRDRVKLPDRDRPLSWFGDNNFIGSEKSQPLQSQGIQYSSDGTCKMTSSAKISIREAYDKLQTYNSQSWKLRIDRILSKTRDKVKESRGILWGIDELPEDVKTDEEILTIPQRPGLMEIFISNLCIKIGKPSFPLSELPEFINRIGKGMPLDMKYALLIPMHIQVDMEEIQTTLRDYPLPLLHVPPVKSTQSSRLPAWSLKADYVIAEESRDSESSRIVKIEILAPKENQSSQSRSGGFAVDVCRTISPVKSYSDIKVDINTEYPTRITWGSSFQPAIQDMMMIFETFTKPQVDPSDRTGFWDKIRLSFHSRVSVGWKNDGDVHLLLKGSRDPYEITGNGAGFIMCWRNNVRCDICLSSDPKRLITVQSGEYILAIPDLSHQARNLIKKDRGNDNTTSSDSFKIEVSFKKVVMKLSGNVQWLAGLIFERNIAESGKRSFEFKPHYEIVLKRPECARSASGLPYDAFRGFRSNHIHLSIAIKAPMDIEFPFSNLKRSSGYSTVHLSPRFFSHFFAWWSMFGGAMLLPIRQGALWPGNEKSSKKFARHLATIKYNLLLAPLFISHVYKNNDTTDRLTDADSATGLKIKIDNFMLDVHQRREELPTYDKEDKTQNKTSSMKMHQAQIDLLSADIRAITASIAEKNLDKNNATTRPTNVLKDEVTLDSSYFDVQGNDLSWVDMDDFVELDWILPSNLNLETKILPLAYAPRFTYLRQTDHNEIAQNVSDGINPFGFEPTHFCNMTKDGDPLWIQYELVKKRKDQVETQIKLNRLALYQAESKVAQDIQNENLKIEVEKLKKHKHFLRDKTQFLESMMQRIKISVNTSNKFTTSNKDLLTKSSDESLPKDRGSTGELSKEPFAEFRSDFKNRFVIHNMQLKWNNLLRNIILRYIHQVSQRRGIVYYLSRRAVKFILDIVQEQTKPRISSKSNKTQDKDSTANFTFGNKIDPIYNDVEDWINEILSDEKKKNNMGDKDSDFNATFKEESENLDSNLSGELLPMNSYHLHLIAPQIQLQSEKNLMAVVLVTAKGMEATVIEVMDKDRIFDNVSGLVQRRFSVEMDSIQFFVTHQNWFSSQLLSLYSGNRYGAPTGSAWPPWVPMEVMFDFKVDPFGFKRVVHKTSASLRYDKYNTLRIKYNDEISREDGSKYEVETNEESRMDHVWVEFPKIHAICNSAQYYAMYIIVMDLLMYSEPQKKTRNERLEKIILASDFTDLRGVPEMVMKLQDRIRQLEQIKTHFQINSRSLDQRGSEDRLLVERDLNSCANELFFMMKAITTSQRKYDVSKTSGFLRWNISSQQIVWHLIRDNNEPLLEFQLQRAEYVRTDNSDGSHINLVQVGKIIGLNLLPDAIYPEIFAPYFDAESRINKEDENLTMLRVYWHMLEAIGGIPIMDHFEVKLVPMKIQLERDIGKKLFDYVFPGSSEDKNRSLFMAKHIQSTYDDIDGNSNDISKSNLDSGKISIDHSKSESSMLAEVIEQQVMLSLHSQHYQHTSSTAKEKAKTSAISSSDGNHFRLFHSQQKKHNPRNASKKLVRASSETRPPLKRLESIDLQPNSMIDPKAKRFNIGRHTPKIKDERSSDDLTKMIGRASSYMTLAHVKIPSVVLCLSYKGKDERNFEDVHDLVFRLPDIEYRNKTWSNLDLALALKRDVIRSLISHTGAIVANKFKHRPNIAQQHRLRELATNSMVLTPSSQETSFDNSDATSSYDTSLIADISRSERSNSSRRSIISSQNSINRSLSFSSSISNAKSVPTDLVMTSIKTDILSEESTTSHGGKLKSRTGVLGRLIRKNENPSTENKKKQHRSIKVILGSGISKEI